MLLSNVLVYDGMLKCGNEAVAKRSLRILDATALAFAKPWVRDVLSERYKLVFCDTDLVPALETKRGDRTTNELEGTFIKQVPPLLIDLADNRLSTRSGKAASLRRQSE